MADNSVQTAADTIRTKDRAGVKTEIVALDLNPAGTETLMAGSMPITGSILTVGSLSVAAAGTGTMTAVDVSKAGNVTFVAFNTVAASPWSGAPVLVFEQSYDGTSWAPLQVRREDNGAVGTTHVLPPSTASGAFAFDAAAEGILWVRCRVTTGPGTNGMTVVAVPGVMPFEPVVSTFDRKDAGRVMFSAACTPGTAGVTTEGLLSLNVTRDAAAPAALTSIPVTANKRLRLTQLIVTVRASAAVASWSRFTLRANPSGAATATSQTVAVVEVGTPAQVIGATQTVVVPLDGLEFTGAFQLGLSHIASATTVLETATLVGYEYAA